MSFPEDPINSYPMGQRIVMSADFKNVAGVAADPDTSATLIYIDGEDVKTTVLTGALDHPSTGRYELGLKLPKDGDKAVKPWEYRFEGVSAAADGVNSADEGRFEVEPSVFYPPS